MSPLSDTSPSSSLNNTVKALSVDGTEASVENIKAGTYSVARPFNIAVKEGLSAQSQDFIDFIMSTEGQKVIEENKYIPSDDTKSYTASGASGRDRCSRLLLRNTCYGKACRSIQGT